MLKKTTSVVTISIALAILLVVAISPAVLAQPLEQERSEAAGEVSRLHERLEDAVEQYNYACYQLEQTRAEISQTKEELAAAEAELEQNKDTLNTRIRSMYMARPNEFLDVVMNAENFDDFLVGLELIKKISNHDAELVKKVKDAREKLLAVQEELKSEEAQQESARAEMASVKANIKSQLNSAEGRLAGIEDEIQQALASRAAAAESSTSSSSSSSSSSPRRRSNPVVDPGSRTEDPGPSHGGVVGVAYNQIGDPYVYGAAGPNSFDCSGLVMYCYAQGAGISLPHSGSAQMGCGTPVSVSEMQPGDIVGFRGGAHVGIYIGGGQFIHAPYSGASVCVSSLSARGDFSGAVRP